MGNKAGCLNAFFVFGLLALAFAVAYKVVFFASYLYLEPYEVDLDCNGGEKDILVHTDAYSWIIEDYYYPSWVTVQKYGSSLLKITVNKNDSKEDRYCDVADEAG